MNNKKETREKKEQRVEPENDSNYDAEKDYYYPEDTDDWGGLDWDIYFGLTNPDDL